MDRAVDEARDEAGDGALDAAADMTIGRSQRVPNPCQNCILAAARSIPLILSSYVLIRPIE